MGARTARAGGKGYLIGSKIGRRGSAYAPGSRLPYLGLDGKSVPKLEDGQIYLVRYSTANERGDVGYFAYGGKRLDDVISATEAYAGLSGKGAGFLHVGRWKPDSRWSRSASDESSGIEVNGVLGSKDAPLDAVFPVKLR